MIVLIWLFSRPFTAYKFQLKFRLKVLREQVNFANLNFKGFNLRIITWHWELVQKLHILFLMIFDSIYNIPFSDVHSLSLFILLISIHLSICTLYLDSYKLLYWTWAYPVVHHTIWKDMCRIIYIVFLKRIMF